MLKLIFFEKKKVFVIRGSIFNVKNCSKKFNHFLEKLCILNYEVDLTNPNLESYYDILYDKKKELEKKKKKIMIEMSRPLQIRFIGQTIFVTKAKDIFDEMIKNFPSSPIELNYSDAVNDLLNSEETKKKFFNILTKEKSKKFLFMPSLAKLQTAY